MAPRNLYTALPTEETSDLHVETGSESSGSPISSRSISFPPSPLASIPASEPSRWKRMATRSAELWNANTGLLLVMSSQGFFACANVAVKKLNSIDPPVPTLELILVRMSITWSCCVIYMLVAGVPHPFLGPPGVRLLLVLRGFTGFFGLFGAYYSLQYLSLSDSTVLQFLAPICTGIVGSFVLKESFSRKEAAAGICSLLGVILIARPPFLFGPAAHAPTNGTSTDPAEKATAAQRLSAVGVSLLGVAGGTIVYITLRSIGKRAHPLHSLASFSSQSALAATIGVIIFRVELVVPTRVDWIAMLIMIGLFGFFAQTLVTMGLQREAAGRATMGCYAQIIFATILERIFFHPAVSLLSLIGTVIIMTSAIYVALTKEIPSTKDTGNYDENVTLEEGLLEGRESEEDADEVKDSGSPHGIAEAKNPNGNSH